MTTTYLKVSYDFNTIDFGDRNVPDEFPMQFSLHFEWSGPHTESVLRSLATINLANKEEPGIVDAICGEGYGDWENFTTLIRAMQSARLVTLPTDALEDFEKRNLTKFDRDANAFVDEIARHRAASSDSYDEEEDDAEHFSETDINTMCTTMQESLTGGFGFLFPIERNVKRKRDAAKV